MIGNYVGPYSATSQRLWGGQFSRLLSDEGHVAALSHASA